MYLVNYPKSPSYLYDKILGYRHDNIKSKQVLRNTTQTIQDPLIKE